MLVHALWARYLSQNMELHKKHGNSLYLDWRKPQLWAKQSFLLHAVNTEKEVSLPGVKPYLHMYCNHFFGDPETFTSMPRLRVVRIASLDATRAFHRRSNRLASPQLSQEISRLLTFTKSCGQLIEAPGIEPRRADNIALCWSTAVCKFNKLDSFVKKS
mmetsp:Transcript_103445/g.163232  ORF Transcript_103445/g.163232 Transcript_103445/m.163232 type:complete len:159 (+) Transcript_103445:70-546(+)